MPFLMPTTLWVCAYEAVEQLIMCWGVNMATIALYKKIVWLLMSSRAWLACRWSHTPLQHAVARRHGPVIELLQKYEARLG